MTFAQARHARTELLTYSLVVAIAALTLAAPTATAQITTPPSGHVLFSVPGVVNNGSFGTYFTCTSTTTDPQTVTVDVFDQTGAASGTGNLVVGAGMSVTFGTQDATGITETTTIGSGLVSSGAARISSTVNKKLICSAFVSTIAAAVPERDSLTVVYKFKQK